MAENEEENWRTKPKDEWTGQDYIDYENAKNNGARNNANFVGVQVQGPTYQESSGRQSSTSEAHSEGTSTGASYADLANVRRDANGKANAEDVAGMKAADEQTIRRAYGLSEAIGANQEKIRAQRDAEAKQNERRAKVAAWTDSARVISDILTAGAGGNVYRRDKDNTAKEMNERNKALRELQAAEDAQAALRDWQNNRDMALAILQNNQRIDQMTAVQRNANSSKSDQNSNSNSSSNTTASTEGHTATSYYEPKKESADYGSHLPRSKVGFSAGAEKANKSGLGVHFEFERGSNPKTAGLGFDFGKKGNTGSFGF